MFEIIPVIGLGGAVVVGVLLIVFRRQFARFTQEMNSETEIDPSAPVPRRYSPGWVAFGGAWFVAFGLIVGTFEVVRLVTG